MRVYFISEERAALKLDGQYAGNIDLFPRFAEIDGARGAFAEIVPDENKQPLNFFIDDQFFLRPHEFADVCTSRGECFIRIDGFDDKGGLRVLAQKNAGGSLITVFSAGGLYAACEGESCSLIALPRAFSEPEISETECAGIKFAAVKGKDALALFFGGREAFSGEVESFGCGRTLKTLVNLHSSTRDYAEREYLFDGEKFIPNGQKITAGTAPAPGTEHIAFFECVKNGGDSSAYLCEELAGHAHALKDYLGDFRAVVPPTDSAIKLYGEQAVGLVYRTRGRLYALKYFIAQMKEGKITNILPAEDDSPNV